MTETAEKKPRRVRRSPDAVAFDELIEEVGNLPMDALFRFAAAMREQFPRVASFLVVEMAKDEPSA